MEKKSLFRRKSLDKIAEPEQLHDYLRVTTPGIWLTLLVLILLLAGGLYWGFRGSVVLHDIEPETDEMISIEAMPIILILN